MTNSRQTGIILSVILLVALILRLWGNWFGLPYLYHQDETHEVIRALELGAGHFDMKRVGKAGYFYLLFFEYGLFFIILKLLGYVQSATDFAILFIRDPSAFYLIGRSTTALLGTLTVFMTYNIGKLAYSRRIGFIAALLLAFNYLHTQSSHYITVDVPMTCMATIALFFMIKISRTGKLIDYVLTGIFIGLAVQTKAPAIVLVFPFLAAHFYFIRSNGYSLQKFIFSKTILTGAIVACLVLFIGNPGLFTNIKAVFNGFWNLYFGTAETMRPGPPGMASPPNLFLYYLYALKESMGLPLLIFSIGGVYYGISRRRKADVILITFVLPFYLMISTSKDPYLFYYRYIIPVLPVLAVLTSRFIDHFSQKLFPKNGELVLFVSVCLLIALPGHKIIRENNLISQKDTRTYAKEWIEDNIPVGSRILIEGMRTKPKEDTVPLRYNRDNILRSMERYQKSSPSKVKYFELELKTLPDKTYDLFTIGGHRELQPIQYYKDVGIDYAVLRADIYDAKRDFLKRKWRSNYNLAGIEIENFLQDLKEDPEVKLIKRFEPDPIGRPGPSVEIYKLKKD